MDGGYDDGYKQCPCFWGRKPGSLVEKLLTFVPSVEGFSILDAGCGEGKNSAYLGQLGAHVDATDISEYAISNAKREWGDVEGIQWAVADVRQTIIPSAHYDIVIAYGVFHCLNNSAEIENLIAKIKQATKIGGYNVVCTFNDRSQDLTAHENFRPCLLPHSYFLQQYADWSILDESDTDLTEAHPHNNIEHTHSMTRLIARNG